MDDDELMERLKAANNPLALYGTGTEAGEDANAKPQDGGTGTEAGQSEEDGDSPAAGHFDTDQFLAGLDAIYDAHEASTKAGPYLEQAMVDAENAGDDAGLLTVLNETMGFYRSQGRHKDNQWIIQRAIELATRMGLEGTEAWTTTLINAATGMRAAGNYDQAEALYTMAQADSERTLSPSDRRLAALHNNLSMLYSETGRTHESELELREALRILETSSPDADADLDVASTNTNLALVLLSENKLEGADWHAAKALEIYRNGHLEHSAHYASALAGYAQVRFHAHDYAKAVSLYRQALSVIEECYGTDTDYYRITAQNLREAEDALAKQEPADPAAAGTGTPGTEAPTAGRPLQSDVADSTVTADAPSPDGTATGSPRDIPDVVHKPSAPDHASGQRPRISGLKLARAYWNEYGKPLIEERYPEYRGRIAAGLVGHGSECYGFDDELSQDHDFGPRFCLWLTDEDYAAIGRQLQDDYETLPKTFMGYGPREATARAQGTNRRDGVFSIGDCFASITGYRRAPGDGSPHEWLMLSEATLAAATNGEVFADPLGEFLGTRQGFKAMPDDVRLSLISKRLGMMAQAGQYNVPRMLTRGDGAAAWLSIREFVDAAASLVFLINEPITAGYMPYYKWQFAALRRLSARLVTRLADVCEQLEALMRLSSAACYGGAGFGEGGKGAAPAAAKIEQGIDRICGEVVKELRREGLTDSDETFLEWQRPYVEEHIHSAEPCLHSL